MSIFKGLDGSGKEISFYHIEEEGLYYAKRLVDMFMHSDLKQKLHDVKHFPSRDDDVFICAYMKSGMHWLQEIVAMVMKQKADYEPLAKEAYMMEFNTTEELNKLPSPRLLNLHFPLRYMPQQAIVKQRPIIHLMRNPKDVCVSYYNHFQTLPTYEDLDNFSAFLPMFTGDNGFYLSFAWYEYELQWEQFTKANPDYPILNLYYEDLKQDLQANVKKIAEFLQVDVSKDLVANIVDKCHIEKMRYASRSVDTAKNFQVNGVPLMYRKGEVGDWKNWFTVAENERFDDWLKSNLVNTELTFKYTL